MKKDFLILGIMSGTSLDGLDIALCRFQSSDSIYKYEIIEAETIKYKKEMLNDLQVAYKMSAIDFLLLHKKYGIYIGEQINRFLKNRPKPDFIASHGHTVFHQPEKELTFQIGDGAFIAATTDLTCISDFRNLDIALKGQGAPLVPIGDKLLFPEYEFCINLGGFANISYDNKQNLRIAYDICPLNIIANRYARDINLPYDNKGKIGKKGNINTLLLKKLNSIKYYNLPYPKSLAIENVEKDFMPILSKLEISVSDKLRTFYEHAATQIAEVINKNAKNNNAKVLLTGGGVYNDFLITLIKQKCNAEIIIPNSKIIEFKEALIFAFLGLLRYQNKNNCISTVTGASKDNSSGVIHLIK